MKKKFGNLIFKLIATISNNEAGSDKRTRTVAPSAPPSFVAVAAIPTLEGRLYSEKKTINP